MDVEQMALQQIMEEFGAVEHKVEFTKKVRFTGKGSLWECCATYVGNIEEYKGSVTKGYGATEEAAGQQALDKAKINKPGLFADRQ